VNCLFVSRVFLYFFGPTLTALRRVTPRFRLFFRPVFFSRPAISTNGSVSARLAPHPLWSLFNPPLLQCRVFRAVFFIPSQSEDWPLQLLVMTVS
jgi:hypothetical protein